MAEQKKRSKFGRNTAKCADYRSRENQGKTAKTRRILRALLRGQIQPGWALAENKKRPFRT